MILTAPVPNSLSTYASATIGISLFTNGSNLSIIDDDYIMDNFKINLSRHAVNDEENALIFNSNLNIMNSKDIERLNLRNGEVTLNATCFNGGLDSLEKIIEYISFAKNIGFPDSICLFTFCINKTNQIFRLLLCSHNG